MCPRVRVSQCARVRWLVVRVCRVVPQLSHTRVPVAPSQGTYFVHRDKIENVVNFPMELDMSERILGPQPDGSLYELYAISVRLAWLSRVTTTLRTSTLVAAV